MNQAFDDESNYLADEIDQADHRSDPRDQEMSGEDEHSKAFQLIRRISVELEKVLFGQAGVLTEVLASLVAGGHVLIEGKPGLGKTHLVLALANSFGGKFSRIQFTPDLMPADVTGHTMFDMRTSEFRVRRGPDFANLLLADEINRAPAKTQAALLEVMQEQQVTIDGTGHRLELPFMTLATQNPIEQEGTYPLPEAQLDRFLIKCLIDYPDEAAECEIVNQVAAGVSSGGIDPSLVPQVCSGDDLVRLQAACGRVAAAPEVVRYAVQLVKATRDFHAISLGAGTRGAISLVRLAKAFAIMNERNFVTPDDIKAGVKPV
jgi:MoxR-like ATPase